MSFRASHYFVSFMSEAALIASGFGCTVAGSQVFPRHFKYAHFLHQQSSTIEDSAIQQLIPKQVLWSAVVTQPHNIEVPRSLVEVVVSWNLPMHRWLKQYVFKQVANSPIYCHTFCSTSLIPGAGEVGRRWCRFGHLCRIHPSSRPLG